MGMGDRHVHVPDDAEEMGGADTHAREELAEILSNHVFQQREPIATFLGGQRDETGQQVRHLDASEFRPAAMIDNDGEIAASIRDMRKGVTGIECQRRQHGAHVHVEMLFDERPVVVCVIRRLDDEDALGGEHRSQPLLPIFRYLVEHGRGLHPRERGALVESHHEKLVEVVRGNRKKLDALEQRVPALGSVEFGLIENTRVERQPAEPAVEIQRRVVEVDGRRSPGSPTRQPRWSALAAHVAVAGPQSGSWPRLLCHFGAKLAGRWLTVVRSWLALRG